MTKTTTMIGEGQRNREYERWKRGRGTRGMEEGAPHPSQEEGEERWRGEKEGGREDKGDGVATLSGKRCCWPEGGRGTQACRPLR